MKSNEEYLKQIDFDNVLQSVKGIINSVREEAKKELEHEISKEVLHKSEIQGFLNQEKSKVESLEQELKEAREKIALYENTAIKKLEESPMYLTNSPRPPRVG